MCVCVCCDIAGQQRKAEEDRALCLPSSRRLRQTSAEDVKETDFRCNRFPLVVSRSAPDFRTRFPLVGVAAVGGV